MPEFSAIIAPAQAGERLDRAIAALVPDVSRSYGQQLIAAGQVSLNGRPARPAQKLQAGDRLAVSLPEPAATAIAPEPMDLRVVYEDAEVIVIDKPSGLVVHPAPGHRHGTLVNGLLAHTDQLSLHGDIRPGIVHRLDKDTSGLLVVARTDAAHAALVRQHQARTMDKEYLGLGLGRPQPPVGLIDAPLGRDLHDRKRQAVLATGRAARTRYTSERVYPPARGVEATTLLRLRLETGRTHQIRVHLAYIGHPIVGDAVYGARAGRTARALGIERQFLHATRLAFDLPASGARVTFSSPLPDDLQAALARLAAAAPAEET